MSIEHSSSFADVRQIQQRSLHQPDRLDQRYGQVMWDFHVNQIHVVLNGPRPQQSSHPVSIGFCTESGDWLFGGQMTLDESGGGLAVIDIPSTSERIAFAAITTYAPDGGPPTVESTLFVSDSLDITRAS